MSTNRHWHARRIHAQSRHSLRGSARAVTLVFALLATVGVTIGVFSMGRHGALEAQSAPWYQVALGRSPADLAERAHVDHRVSKQLAGIPQSGNALGQPSGLAAVRVDTRHGSDGLVRSGIEAVLALVRARGSAVPAPATSPSSQGSRPA